MATRGVFSSRLGFILAASGSAVGLGNVWGFPSQVASNGGAAFVLMYLVLAFVLAYPVLMAELLIGRATESNVVDALGSVSKGRSGRVVGMWGIATVSLILAFYGIVGGWMLSYTLEALASLAGLEQLAQWLIASSLPRNILFCGVFMLLTVGIVSGGVVNGIERWSVRLMPTLFVLMLLLFGYVMTQDGAMDGLKVYLLPDFTEALNPELLISAMGQAFFSMSLGVGTMLIYGSYVSHKENLPKLGASVALVDIGVAVLAGLLIIPAMYVALHNGVEIFGANGELLAEDTLIFTVLPSLFTTMGSVGLVVASAFFLLMSIAALTSSISMLEVPVSYVVENRKVARNKAVWLIAAIIFSISVLILANFELLFGFVIALTTQYSQPLLGLMLCIFAGWIWNRNSILAELKKGDSQAEHSWFWRVWPWYVKFVCPVIIVLMFYRSL
ncbi:MAG: sodium-dependent transporter [Rheinheimera sp.]|uniref:sodium-dependent transporter n=1 Tax=Arsukibacterium sp. UBA3155 TaxID=1946058 RepID=UPI000C8E35ED|nr:sodium-dependent transporter [Arsukibacterium sp. UBA3155]MAD74418.1 sodium-dependent transporter [Rheinheimera sp.]|tara:strand:- start:34653 stop:35984 length:1332 start_codon:yes stop_codon:yes gene_type:complete